VNNLTTRLLAVPAFFSILMFSACSDKAPSVDLKKVLEITEQTLTQFEDRAVGSENAPSIDAFAEEFAANLNTATPPVYPEPLGVIAGEDGSFKGYQDSDGNSVQDSGEADLFTIEIDGEGSRLIATDVNSTVQDRHFSGGGLLAGLLIGQMLGRQRAAGVNPKSLSSKKSTPARSSNTSAKSKAGSGSHSSGK